MMRITPPCAAGLIVAALVAGCLSAAGAVAEPTLRTNVVVTGPSIRLGDLFSDAGPRAVVERASQSVAAETIIAELRQELGNRLPGGQSELTLDNADLHLLVPAGPAPAISVDALNFDAR